MRFIHFNYDKNEILYKYSDEDDKSIDDLLPSIFSEGYNKDKGYYIKALIDETNILYFCFKRVKGKNEAKFKVKMAIEFYRDTFGDISIHKRLEEKTAEVALHNTKNINAQIFSKISNLVNHDKLIRQPDKIEYLLNKINREPIKFAREILNIIRSMEHIQVEYNIIDYLKSKSVITDQDKISIKIHTLIVMSFYIFEQDFKEKGTNFNVNETREKVYINFNTIKTAIIQILDNSIKYVKPKENITVSCERIDNMIHVHFDMTSIFIDDGDMCKLTLPEYRGSYAQQCVKKGSGFGLYIAKKLINLNNGDLIIEKLSPTIIECDDIKYSMNRFTIVLPAAKE